MSASTVVVRGFGPVGRAYFLPTRGFGGYGISNIGGGRLEFTLTGTSDFSVDCNIPDYAMNSPATDFTLDLNLCDFTLPPMADNEVSQ